MRACVTAWPWQGECASGPLIHLGIEAGRLAIARPSQLTDLDQRGAGLEQLGGQRMAQQRRASERGVEPGPRQCAAHDRPDRLPVDEATARRPHPDKELPCRARRSAVTEVGDEGVADLVWQWEAITARTLAPDEEFPGVPIQIIQGQGRHFTSPSAEPGQQEHNRVITLPVVWAAVTASSQAFDVLGFHQPGQA
jgi:hypothetical protein